jgi:hypothetical protein
MHMLGEFKAALERAARNAPVEDLAFHLSMALPTDGEPVAMGRDFEVVLAEASDGHRHTVLVVGELDGVKRWVVVGGLSTYGGGFEKLKHAVKADTRTVERCHTQESHGHILQNASNME